MQLLDYYEKIKTDIKERLEDFKEVWNRPEEDIFAELCFCLCTPQTRARTCDAFITRVKSSGLLFRGTEKEIRNYMKGIRFCENKSRYIINARNFFTEEGKIRVKPRIEKYAPGEARTWLVKNIKGLGMKEASHFLRNVGLGKNLAILDRHILKNLKIYGVIEEVPNCLTAKRYREIEEKMKKFSKNSGIPLAELDLLFWSKETGEIFK